MKKAKGTVFIEHIQKHLDEMFSNAELICTICDMNVDEIYEEYKKEIANERTS